MRIIDGISGWRGRSIGFGLERLGALAVRLPRISVTTLAVLTILSFLVLPNARFDANLMRIYEDSGPDYAALAEVADQFGMFENDLLLVASSPRMTAPPVLARVRDLMLDLSLESAVSSVMSPFSLRRTDGDRSPYLREDLASTAEVVAALAQARSDISVTSMLVSADNLQVTMIVTPIDADPQSQQAMLGSVRALVDRFADEDLAFTVIGQSAWMEEAFASASRDQTMFSIAGLLVGVLTALLIFRSWRVAVVVAATPVLASIWISAAVIALFGQFTFFTMILATIVMVLTFAEAIYFMHAWQRIRAEGEHGRAAAKALVARVGPASALSMLTTLAAFLSLGFAPGRGVFEFAVGGALGVALAFVALIAFLPMLLWWSEGWVGDARSNNPFTGGAAGPLRWLGHFVVRYPRVIVAAGLVTIGLCIGPYFMIKPSFSFSDFAGPAPAETRTDGAIASGIGGVAPIYLMIELDDDGAQLSLNDLARLSAAATSLETVVGENQALSLNQLVAARTVEEANAILVAAAPDMTRRLISADGKKALFTIFADPSLSSESLRALKNNIEAAMQAAGVGASRPAGFRLLTTYATEDIIDGLEFNLLTAIVVGLVLFGLAFRSYKAALLACLPNVFPILVSVAFIYVSGGTQKLTSVFALVVAFGVAIDDTVHLTNEYMRARQSGQHPDAAVKSALSGVGTAMIATTLILCLGTGVTLFSELPQSAEFGWLFITAMVLALVGDLLLLPAALIAFPSLNFGDPRSSSQRNQDQHAGSARQNHENPSLH